MADTIMGRAFTKAMAKITSLEYDVKKLQEELKYDNGNGVVSKEQLELCLHSTERELDIWKLIYRLIENEESRTTEMV